MQFRVLLDIGLYKDRAFFRIQSCGKIVDCGLENSFLHRAGIRKIRRQRVPIDDAEIHLIFILKRYPISEGSLVIAKVQLARGLHALRVKYRLPIDHDSYRNCGNHPDTDLSRLLPLWEDEP